MKVEILILKITFFICVVLASFFWLTAQQTGAIYSMQIATLCKIIEFNTKTNIPKDNNKN